MKESLIKVLALIIPMIAVYAGAEVLAYYYESYNAIGANVGGVKGTISITSPYIDKQGFGASSNYGNKDYIVYVLVTNDRNDGTIGAGWIAYKDANNIIRKHSLVYIYDQRYPVPLYDIRTDVSSATSIATEVRQNSNENCWTATTYGYSRNWCFESTYNKGYVAGSVAQSPQEYIRNRSDMPGLFDQLQFYNKNVNEWRNFSTVLNNKCNSNGAYVLDYLVSINRVGTGPRTYTTDDCAADTTVWSPLP